MNGHGIGIIICAKIDDELAIAVEAPIQAAIGIVARQGKVIVAAVIGETNDNDLAICLHSHGPAHIIQAIEVSGEQAAGAKSAIQAAIGVVARQGEIIAIAAVGVRLPSHNDSAICLQGNGITIIIAAEVSDHEAAGAKTGVQAAVIVVARQGKVLASAAGGNDLAIRLNDDTHGIVVAAEVSDDDAAGAEAGIQGAVIVVTRQAKVAAAAGAGAPCHNELAIGLQGQTAAIAVVGESSGYQATVTEAGIQRPAHGRCKEQQAKHPAGVETVYEQRIAVHVGVIRQHVGQGEGRVFVGDEARARVVIGNRGVIDGINGEVNGGQVRVEQAIVGAVGEAVWTVVVERGGVGEGAVRVECQRTVSRDALQHGAEHLGRDIAVAVVDQHARGSNSQNVVFGDIIGIIHSNRRVVEAGDGDADCSGVGQCAVGGHVCEGVGRHFSGSQPIELAIGVVGKLHAAVVARQGKVIRVKAASVSGGDEFSIRLHSQAIGRVVMAKKVGHDPAIRVERGIQ